MVRQPDRVRRADGIHAIFIAQLAEAHHFPQVIGDFQTSANKSYGPFQPTLSDGWYAINLTPGKNFVNKLASGNGLTQIRLRFKLDDNNNGKANFLKLFSGNAPAASRPQLIVEYYVP
jgi:hypothetical protein